MYQFESSVLFAGTGVWKISSVACIDYSDYPKSLISRKNKVYVFFNKISLQRYFIEKNINFIYNGYRLFCCNHTGYCVNMVSVTSATRVHPLYESRYSMYIRGLIPRKKIPVIGRGSSD